MRKATILTMVFGVALLVTQPSHAIMMKGKLAISPYGGGAIPIGDMADADPENEKAKGAETGFNAGGAAEFFIAGNLAVGGRVNYNRFGVDEMFLNPDPGVSYDLNQTVIDFGAYLKWLFATGGKTHPYVRAGAMIGKQKLSGDATAKGETADIKATVDNALGIEGAIGVLHMFSEQVGGFVEGQITHLMTDDKDVELEFGGDTDTEKVQGDAQWITIRAGLTIFVGK